MSLLHHSVSLLTVAIMVAGAQLFAQGGAGNGTEHKIAQLERQLANMRESYALARADAEEARKQLRDIRTRLEALGGAALGDSEEKIIDTASQLEAARADLETLRQSSLRVASAISSYMRGALVEDAVARQVLESSLREQEVALGLRMPPKDELAGSVTDARVLSIDSESGLIVINAGRDAKVEVGMPMQVTRGDQAIAKTIVTDVRKKVAGMLVQKHLNPALAIGVGDHVSVTSNE